MGEKRPAVTARGSRLRRGTAALGRGTPRSRGSAMDPAASRPAAPQRALLSSAGRALLWLGPVYLAGYLGLSGSWLLLGLALALGWARNRRGKRERLAAASALLEDEREAVRRGLAARHLPAWVHFPDVERVEWLNKVLEQAWPYFGAIMEKTFKEVVEPKIRAKSVHLKTCTFTKIQFGEKCPRINGVKVYTKEIDRRQVILDLQICYVGDCEIHMDISKFNLGVKGVQLYGTLRVILEPLLTDAPFIGAVTLFFMQKPHLEFNWAGMSNLLDVPGINVMSDSLIQDYIAARLVLPNRITVPLKKNMSIAQLRFPIPHGVIRVHLLEAENLVQKDNFLGAIRGKSDPYALLRLGTVQYRSKTISRDLNPVWNETFEFVVHEVLGQDLEVDLYDADPDKDDFMDKDQDSSLGTSVVCLSHLLKDPNMTLDQRFQLDHSSSDSFIKIKLVLRVSCLLCSLGFPSRSFQIYGTEMPLGEIQLTVRYASIRQSLVVLVNGCRNLIPSSNRGVDPYVRIYLLPDRRWTSRKKTSVKKKTLNPQYDEKFEFFESLEEVKKRTLDVAVKNSRPFISQEKKELGKVRIDLSQEDLIKGFTQW
uniref:Extended synaptotagmin 3 n=1 Tax=Pavo cristatus TaxID=9049 RepID=A0A8C9L9K6_PAVCR